MKWALEAGYRMIDTAAIYQNEDSVGAAQQHGLDQAPPKRNMLVVPDMLGLQIILVGWLSMD